jgi:hypothetical protein
MKIFELIDHLKELQIKHGNLDVYCYYMDSPELIETVELETSAKRIVRDGCVAYETGIIIY